MYADLDRSRDKYEKLQGSMIRMEEEKDKIETEANRHLAQVKMTNNSHYNQKACKY